MAVLSAQFSRQIINNVTNNCFQCTNEIHPKPWALKHCLIVWAFLNLRDSSAADKTLTQRLLYMSIARLPPVQASERTTGQN